MSFLIVCSQEQQALLCHASLGSGSARLYTVRYNYNRSHPVNVAAYYSLIYRSITLDHPETVATWKNCVKNISNILYGESA